MDPSLPPSEEFLLNALCSRCGYDLRSNNVVGPCPKCGFALAYASVNSELRLANPLWLYRIAMGIAGVAIAQLLFAVETGWNLLVLLSNCSDFDADQPGLQLSDLVERNRRDAKTQQSRWLPGIYDSDRGGSLSLVASPAPEKSDRFGAGDQKRRRRSAWSRIVTNFLP